MFCGNCGAQLSEADKFCPACGAPVGAEDSQNAGAGYPENANGDNGYYYNGDPQYQGYQQNYQQGYQQNYQQDYQQGYQQNYQQDYHQGYQQDYQQDYQQGYQQNYQQGYSYDNSSQKTGFTINNWRDLFTPEGIEKFSPIVAFTPLAMKIVTSVLIFILFATLGRIPAGNTVVRAIRTILRAIFILVTAGLTGGSIYVIIKKGVSSSVSAWLVPIAGVLSTISCIAIAYRGSMVALIFGIPAFILGIELVARILISGMPIESPFDFGNAINTYKSFISNYRANHPTTKDLEKANIADPENSGFDGKGVELLGYLILTVLLSCITCGLATPWMLCKIYRWRYSHSIVNGQRLTFTGTGAGLLGLWIVNYLLSLITCGIYGYFAYVVIRRWECKHVFIEGEPISEDGSLSYFDGSIFEYVGYAVICTALLGLTCGLAYPWVMSIIQKWDTGHQIVNKRRMAFSGSGFGFLGEYLIIAFLTLITFGIYSPWGIVRLNKYILRNTDFVS